MSPNLWSDSVSSQRTPSSQQEAAVWGGNMPAAPRVAPGPVAGTLENCHRTQTWTPTATDIHIHCWVRKVRVNPEEWGIKQKHVTPEDPAVEAEGWQTTSVAGGTRRWPTRSPGLPGSPAFRHVFLQTCRRFWSVKKLEWMDFRHLTKLKGCFFRKDSLASSSGDVMKNWMVRGRSTRKNDFFYFKYFKLIIKKHKYLMFLNFYLLFQLSRGQLSPC